MTIGKSREDYLEAILVLQKDRGAVHSVDVAHYLEYSKPSVSRAVAGLKADGLVEMQPGGVLTLTKEGRKIAEDVYDRHTILTGMLTSLGVAAAVAAADACRIEHVISEESFARIKAAYKQPAGGKKPEKEDRKPGAENAAPEKEGKEKRKKKKKKKG